ncbi:MAG: alpha/beta fold hydrolase [Betaproteobacteria bacterium]
MPLVRIGDIDINYRIDGDGPWLTLAHPLAAELGIWAPQMPVLTPHFRVLRFDFRGHGTTSSTPAPYSLGQLARDALGLFDHLGIQKSHWVGLSMGGMVAQVLALQRPGVLNRMVIADSTSRRPANAAAMWGERIRLARERGMAAIAQPTLERWFTAPFRNKHPEIMDWVAAQIERTSLEGYCGSCAAIAEIDTLDHLGKIGSPALIMVGEHDHGTPPEMSRQMHEHWPESEFFMIPDASHIGNIEQAEIFNLKIAEYLTRQ